MRLPRAPRLLAAGDGDPALAGNGGLCGDGGLRFAGAGALAEHGLPVAGVELDPELALAVHREARGALARLVEAHQDALFGYALRLLGDRAEAEDATQEAFLRAHHALTAVYDEARCRDLRVRPWLLRIVRNLAYNRLRSRRAAGEEPLPAAEGWHEPALRVEPVVEEELAERDRKEELERALARLDAAGREVLQLRFVQGLSFTEIAAVTGGSAASARGKVFRALARLRGPSFQEEARYAL